MSHPKLFSALFETQKKTAPFEQLVTTYAENSKDSEDQLPFLKTISMDGKANKKKSQQINEHSIVAEGPPVDTNAFPKEQELQSLQNQNNNNNHLKFADTSPSASTDDPDLFNAYTLSQFIKQEYKLDLTPKALCQLNSFLHDSLGAILNSSQIISKEKEKERIDSEDIHESILTMLRLQHQAKNSHNSSRPLSSYYILLDQVVHQCETVLAETQGWMPLGRKHDVDRFVKDDGHSTVQIIKARGNIHTGIENVRRALGNIDLWAKWEPFYEKGEVVEVYDNVTNVYHLKYRAHVCFLKRARDFVILHHKYHRPDGSWLYVATSIDHPLVPEDKSSYVRGKVFFGCWLLKPISDNCTECTFLAHMDLVETNEMLKTNFIKLVQQQQSSVVANFRKFLTGSQDHQEISLNTIEASPNTVPTAKEKKIPEKNISLPNTTHTQKEADSSHPTSGPQSEKTYSSYIGSLFGYPNK